jgi:hypothetical protein
LSNCTVAIYPQSSSMLGRRYTSSDNNYFSLQNWQTLSSELTAPHRAETEETWTKPDPRGLSLDSRALSLNSRALSLDSRALSLDYRALSLDSRALANLIKGVSWSAQYVETTLNHVLRLLVKAQNRKRNRKFKRGEHDAKESLLE